MFLEYFRLRQQPFGVTPDPAFVYPSRTFREALSSLTVGIGEGRGFLALIAEPGLGKTTLLYHLFEQLRDSARTALLFQTQCDSREFFQYLLSELGEDSQGMGLVAMHSRLNELLFAEMLSGRRFVLVVDEAQNLTEPVLETVRMLSNFETSHTKLLQIVLAGQPQLAEKLNHPRLIQLRQRIAAVARLAPLSCAETGRYIDHRLQIAGYTGAAIFTPEAVDRIAEASGGIPRSINNICYSALAAAHAAKLEAVTHEIVYDVVSKLSLDSLVPPAPAEAAVPAPEPPRRIAPPAPPLATPAAPVAALPAPQLTYRAAATSGRNSWASGAAIVAGILIFAGLSFAPLIARLMEPWRATAASIAPERNAAGFAPSVASEFGPVNSSFSADPEDTASGQVITVVVGQGQTLEQISRAYIGRFDPQLLEEIRKLNPALKDPDHLEPGQLIRLPLPHGALTKGLDLATEK